MQALLDVRHLTISFHTYRGLLEAVHDVSLTVNPGETVGIVGESGCGKSVTSQAAMKLLPAEATEYTGGQILWDGRDVIPLAETQMNRLRAVCREAELAGIAAWQDGVLLRHEDCILALNRLSSYFYLLQLRAATGDAIIRLDAHARMPKDFLQKNLDALARGKDIVGGSVIGADPDNAWEAVTRALATSRFCGGAAPFRNGGEARYVDTLAYALYRREVYDRVGFYDERLRRTEDNDMHYRMRKAGYRFYFSPDIVSWHAARKTLRGQLSQKWGNGYWIGRTMRIQPRCFAPRHLVPALFVLALALGYRLDTALLSETEQTEVLAGLRGMAGLGGESAATALGISEPSVYRYLQKVRKEG